jgi:hypothetical protein
MSQLQIPNSTKKISSRLPNESSAISPYSEKMPFFGNTMQQLCC